MDTCKKIYLYSR